MNVSAAGHQVTWGLMCVPAKYSCPGKPISFGEQVNVTECVEFVKTNDRAEAFIIGAETALMDLFFVRLGLNTVQEDEREEGISAGAGILLNLGNYKGSFDYAYTDFGRLQSIHRFSVGLSF